MGAVCEVQGTGVSNFVVTVRVTVLCFFFLTSVANLYNRLVEKFLRSAKHQIEVSFKAHTEGPSQNTRRLPIPLKKSRRYHPLLGPAWYCRKELGPLEHRWEESKTSAGFKAVEIIYWGNTRAGIATPMAKTAPISDEAP